MPSHHGMEKSSKIMAKRCASFIVLTHFLSLVMAVSLLNSSTKNANGYKLFESHKAPVTFTKRAIPTTHRHTLNLQIGLKSDGMKNIEKRLMEVSDPSSPLYGHHLDLDQVNELSTPSESTLIAIVKWLSNNGFDESSFNWSHSKDWITLNNVPLHKAEKMLDTTYFYYQHNDGDTLIRTESYSLPQELHSHVELIQPTTMFGRLQRKGSLELKKSKSNARISHSRTSNGRDRILEHKEELDQKLSNQRLSKLHRLTGNQFDSMTPQPSSSACSDPYNVTNRCLRELYKTDSYTLRSSGNINKIGVTAYISERANYQDLKQFLIGEGLASNSNFTVVSVNGGTNPQVNNPDEMEKHVGAEGNLDIQTTVGFTAPMSNIFYVTKGTPPFTPDLFTTTNSNEPYLEWLQYMSSQPNSAIPQVISTSYGDDEQTVPLSYANKVCQQFAALGARGVSLIFSSGDDGVGQEGTCESNDGKKTKKFIPIFPASCPYVTSVGATQNFLPEVAVSVDGAGGFSSGGGFSEYFQAPDYQSSQVQQYLSNLGDLHSGLYSNQGRGIPDVSAQGARYSIIWQKLRVNVGGSSAAAPTFASVIALLNDYRLANGWQPLGFLNPWLYSKGYEALNDIVTGSSSGCGTIGFTAGVGWDPVTGLGTPDFQAMKALMVASSSARQKDSHGFLHGIHQTDIFHNDIDRKIFNVSSFVPF